MTDSLITLLIVGGCALFIGIRILKSFSGKGDGCSCSCSGGCSTSSLSAGKKTGPQIHLQNMPKHVKQQEEN